MGANGKSKDHRDPDFDRGLLEQRHFLLGRALKLTRNLADAEDLVQTTFLHAVRSYHTFTPGTNLQAWLATILSRAFLNSRRGHGGRTISFGEDEFAEREHADPLDPVEYIEHREGLYKTKEAIKRLPIRWQECIELICIKGLSYEEAAAFIGKPVGTLKSRVSRARRVLALELGEAWMDWQRPRNRVVGGALERDDGDD